MKRLLSLILALSCAVGAAALPAKADSTGTPILGIDVSTHNKAIDWSQVKNSGVQFAMIRDGYGGTPGMWDDQKDEYFEQNYSGATAAGVKVGVYHYSYATTVEMAENEANECLYILNGRHLDYPVAYDVEDKCQYGLSRETLGQIVQTFCDKIAAAGYTPMVYSNKNFFLSHLDSTPVYSYDAWVAQYGASAPGMNLYTMWQYTSGGSVPGISGSVDMNCSYVDYSAGGGSREQGMDPLTFESDTPAYTFGSNKTYVYKISTPDTYPPTAKSSNPSAVTVSGATPTYRGFLFTLTNVGTGTATITTTAGDGRSISFEATGTAAADTLKCDTSSYAFTPGGITSYCYKITTNAATAPAVSSSNTSAVTVAYAQKLSDGYLYRIANVGAGTATITTTAADGASVSFQATGTTAPANTLKCDTSSYTFVPGGITSYCYKITTNAATAPVASSSNASAVTVAYAQKLSDGYLYRITSVGAGTAMITTTAASGASVSFQAVGTVAPDAMTALKSDTPYNFSMKKGAYYTYKFNGSPNVSYQFVCAATGVIRAASLTKQNGSYYLKIYAAGSGQAGIYASGAGKSQRVGIVTVR